MNLCFDKNSRGRVGLTHFLVLYINYQRHQHAGNSTKFKPLTLFLNLLLSFDFYEYVGDANKLLHKKNGGEAWAHLPFKIEDVSTFFLFYHLYTFLHICNL
jgi:hypothetical protein